MAIYNERDHSRTSGGKTHSQIRKHTAPPRPGDKSADISQRWQWLTIELMSSIAFRSLTANACKAFFRLLIEHTAQGAVLNGKLIVTHPQFVEYGVTGEYVADAIDELQYKGLIKVQRGRSGSGTAHPNLYTLTFVGDYEGARATDDWRRVTREKCKQWSEVDRKRYAAEREKVGRKKNSSLRDSEIRPLRDSEIRRAS